MEMRWIATVDIYTGEEAGDWLRLFHALPPVLLHGGDRNQKEAGPAHASATSANPPPKKGNIPGLFTRYC